MNKNLIFFFAIFVFALLICGGCKKKYTQPVILWTNQSEFAAYAELFNASQDKVKVLAVYKKNPVESFPPAKDEDLPDIVIGPWLKNEGIRGNFMPLDYLFDDRLINRSQFYPQLLKLGNVNNKQYLLPLSFNLSAVIFSTNFIENIPDNYMLTPDQIRDAGQSFNKTDKNGVYTSMGFAPSWTPDFLYQIAKLRGASFSEPNKNFDTFSWNQNALDAAIDYVRNWTSAVNTSTRAENDYKFKYLYNPAVKWITEKHCLFAYTTSDALFSSAPEKLQGIDFRWIQEGNSLPIEDDMVSLGLYKYSNNLPAAEFFVIWFMNEENQKAMLEWRSKMNLYTNSFGISGGFSSLRSVNERVFSVFYPALLGNLPPAEYLSTPNILPANWENIKSQILLPYLLRAVNTDAADPAPAIPAFIADWKRRAY